MGTICVLLGIIVFLGLTGAGALAANAIIEKKEMLARAITSLGDLSNTSILVTVICFFAVIGLLIGLNLVMNGLTYNKVSKMYRMAKQSTRRREQRRAEER